MAEDDIDTEMLQAQIDMSLSFAQDLVSSWIKPLGSSAKKATSSKDAEKELEEILRRPARLGVGAPLPEAVGVNGRDTARLKNKLAGSKRPREDEASTSKTSGKAADDDDDDTKESRADAIRKKVKVDPFEVKKKKKGKGKELDGKAKAGEKEEDDNGKQNISMEAVLEGKQVQDDAAGTREKKAENKTLSEAMDMDVDVEDQAATKLTESKRKKKKKKQHIAANSTAEPGADAPDDAPHISSSDSPMTPARPAATASVSTLSSPSNVPTSTPHPTTAATPKLTPSAKRNPFVLLDQPVLNLIGPPPNTEGQDAQASQTSPKKRRKRKKKKKAKTEQVEAVSSDEES